MSNTTNIPDEIKITPQMVEAAAKKIAGSLFYDGDALLARALAEQCLVAALRISRIQPGTNE